RRVLFRSVSVKPVGGDIDIAADPVADQLALRLPLPLGLHRHGRGTYLALVDAQLSRQGQDRTDFLVHGLLQRVDLGALAAGNRAYLEAVGHGLNFATAADADAFDRRHVAMVHHVVTAAG